jgi:hypothetical protein
MVNSKGVWHVEDEDVDVVTDVEVQVEIVVAEIAEDKYTKSPQ